MTINFNGIPSGIRTPGSYIEFDNSMSLPNLPIERQRALLVGSRSGTSLPSTINQAYQITSASQAGALFGARSPLATMCSAWLKVNQSVELWAMPVTTGGGATSATGTITLGGSPTADGVLSLYFGGVLVAVPVATGDTPTVMGGKVIAALNAAATPLMTGANAVGVITLTARFGGEAGNELDVRVNYRDDEALPAGVTVAIVPMAGGTLNATLQAMINAIGDQQYETIVSMYSDPTNTALMVDFMADRFGPMIQKEGLYYIGKAGSVGELQTFGSAYNSNCMVVSGSGKSPTPPWIWAATQAALDAGEPDPARPRQTLVIPNVLPPERNQIWIRDDRNTLLYSGVSTFLVDNDGTCRIERLITTYETDAFGFEDISYLNVETLRTLFYFRFSWRFRLAQKYPRHKLADDGTLYGPGQAIVTPSVLRAEAIAIFQDWMYAGLAEDLDQFKTDLIMERNASDPDRVDAVIPPNTVNQFRVFAGQIQFRL